MKQFNFESESESLGLLLNNLEGTKSFVLEPTPWLDEFINGTKKFKIKIQEGVLEKALGNALIEESIRGEAEASRIKNSLIVKLDDIRRSIEKTEMIIQTMTGEIRVASSIDMKKIYQLIIGLKSEKTELEEKLYIARSLKQAISPLMILLNVLFETIESDRDVDLKTSINDFLKCIRDCNNSLDLMEDQIGFQTQTIGQSSTRIRHIVLGVLSKPKL